MKQSTQHPKSIAKRYPHSDFQIPGMKLSRHCLATVIVKDQSILFDAEGFDKALNEILAGEDVRNLGCVTHIFDNNSFTSVIALAESHISVHTWPERFAVQLDVFLCNYVHDNTDKCERIFMAIVDYFDPEEIEQVYLDRL